MLKKHKLGRDMEKNIEKRGVWKESSQDDKELWRAERSR